MTRLGLQNYCLTVEAPEIFLLYGRNSILLLKFWFDMLPASHIHAYCINTAQGLGQKSMIKDATSSPNICKGAVKVSKELVHQLSQWLRISIRDASKR